jgi:hypothetical protein
MLIDGMTRRAKARRVAIVVELRNDDKGEHGQHHHRRRGGRRESHPAGAKPGEQSRPA